jgi:hypothetical protein
MFTARKSLRNIRTLTDLKTKQKTDLKKSVSQLIQIRDRRNAILQELDVLDSQEQKILTKKARK